MQDLTERFKSIEAKAPRLKLLVKGTVYNLHGIGERRPQEIQSTVLSQVDEVSAGEKQDTQERKSTRKKQADVRTFERRNGKIVAPLGGRYGYIFGALLTATTKYGAERAKRGSIVFGLKTKLQQGVFIEPEFVELGDTFSNPPDKPRGFFIVNPGITEYYDYVTETPVEFTIRAESDISQDIFLELLAFIQRVGIGPKRRGMLKVETVQRID